MNWKQFQVAAPQIADAGAERFQRFGIALLGTLRVDGSPRIRPVGTYFIPPNLILGMIWQSRKALDLLRDPRCVLHSVITDPDANEGEFKLQALAIDKSDEPSVTDHIRKKWRMAPSKPVHVFAVDVLRASFIEYELDRGKMIKKTWDPRNGQTVSKRAYP